MTRLRTRVTWILTRAAAILLFIMLPGCFTYTFQDKRFEPGETHDEWRNFFLFGIIGENEVNVSDFCPNGEAAEVSVGTNGGTWFVSWITLGIYTPDKIYITCSAGSVQTNEDEEEAYLIEFDKSRLPKRVAKHSGGKFFTGTPRCLGGQEPRYALNFREEAP